MTNKEIKHTYTDEIVCPWCGHEYVDSWEEEGETGDLECGMCFKPFGYDRNVIVTYSTVKQKCPDNTCEYELEYKDWGTNPYIHEGKNWTAYKCKKCDNEITKTSPIAPDGKPYVAPLAGGK